jgi:hypothetical protein
MTDMKIFYAHAAQIYRFWLGCKAPTGEPFQPCHAAGLLAQSDAESSLRPDAIGDHHEAEGLNQLHPDRRAAILKGAGLDVSAKAPLLQQLAGYYWELCHPEHHALRMILAARTAYDAGYAAARFWERPGSTMQYGRRGDKAEIWATWFARHPVTP